MIVTGQASSLNILLTTFSGDVLSQDGCGKTLVMTGGNRGIGWEALKVMLPLGYHVILGEFG